MAQAAEGRVNNVAGLCTEVGQEDGAEGEDVRAA